MSAQLGDDEREWAADKREFVADRRDEVAAERDALVQARETTTDAREQALDERERRLTARANDPNTPAQPGIADLADERAARNQGRLDRADARSDRDTAGAAREEATTRRHTDNPSLRLATAFAAIAEHLYASDSYDEVLQRIAETAVSTVTGCDMASITVTGDGGYRTAASTDPDATSVDKAQYAADEGPSLDAITTPVVHTPSFPDDRWAALAAQPTDFGVHSALSYQLTADRSGSASLTSYGVEPHGFDDEAQDIGLILAAHASGAARALEERDVHRQIEHNLTTALSSRDVIGQAKGILMERLHIPPEEAFDTLRRSSQRLNEKLRGVAGRLAETGQLDSTDTPRSTRK